MSVEKKIIVVGSPGSGKSYFSKIIGEVMGIEVTHMDMLFWNSDKTYITDDELVNKLNNVMLKDEWIIDGNYKSTMELRLKEASIVFFLDFTTEQCIEGITNRVGKPRDDMPWIEESVDPEFLKFVLNFKEEYRPSIIELLEKYEDKIVYVFKDRDEMNQFIDGLTE